MLNLYPDQLRRIAAMCEALNKIDDEDPPETQLMFEQGIPVIDEHGTTYGYLRDEIGGSWSFFMRSETDE